MLNFSRPERRGYHHLINILKCTKNHHPNFTLFLGAGASVESRVKSANKMIDEWEEYYYNTYCTTKNITKTEFLSQQTWYNKENAYSVLFEKLYDQPSLRREYIESCLENACPSFGYIYLVRLIENRVFNTVFTTNFDDLLNESCYLFSSNVRPIVCAHDSSIKTVRISSKRPKIIKLHGDFLFDNIKNTLRELETLEDNMRDKFRQYANEFGMIFIGYSGRDRSILDSLDALMRTESKFPHGIYWCVRKGSQLSESVQSMQRFSNFHVIEINSFDHFMAELHQGLEYGDNPLFKDPYLAVNGRLTTLLSNIPITWSKSNEYSILDKNTETLGGTLLKDSRNANNITAHRLMAAINYRQNRADNTIKHSMDMIQILANTLSSNADQLFINTTAIPACTELSEHVFPLMSSKWNDKFCRAYIDLLNLLHDKYGILHFQHILSPYLLLLNLKKYEFAEELLRHLNEAKYFPPSINSVFTINEAQYYVHKNIEMPEDLKERVQQIENNSSNPYELFGISCLKRDTDKAIEYLAKYLQLPNCSHTTQEVLSWPIIKLLPPEAATRIEALY